MIETKRKKLRFSDVAHAIGATPKALRKMLQNPNVVLPLPVAVGWTEFSLVQVAVLALSRRFIEFGCSVPSATSNACLVLLESVVVHKATAGLSAGAFLRLLSSSFAFVFFDEGIHKIAMKHGKRCPPVPEGLKGFPVLIIPVGEVVKLAFSRAGFDPDDDMAGSDMSIAQALLKLQTEWLGSSKDMAAIRTDIEKAEKK